MLEEVNLSSLSKLSVPKDHNFNSAKWFLCFSPEVLHAFQRVKPITCLVVASEILQGWKQVFSVVSFFVKDSSLCCGYLSLYLIEEEDAWKSTIGFSSVMSQTQKNESLGWKNCLLFFSSIAPAWCQAGTYKFIASNKLWVCRCHVDSPFLCRSDNRPGMPYAGCCNYRR